MKIGILGCGSMGTVLGAFLTRGGLQVDFIDNYKAHVDMLNEAGVHIVGTQDFTEKVNAMLPEEMEGIYDLIFLFTKQTANEEVLTNLRAHLGENSIVCTLQNGIPEPFVAEYVGEERTVGGTVLWSATFREPGVSELTQDLTTLDHYFEVGEMDGKMTDRIQMVADVLGKMGNTRITQELMASRWSKLVNNACMSGMSAATGLTFGGVLDDPKASATLSYLCKEVYDCSKAEGYDMPLFFGYDPKVLDVFDQRSYEENQRVFKDVYSVALPAKASMLQDLEKGRKTEVKMINGYVSQVGRKHGIPTPFNDTVVKIVTGVEEGTLEITNKNIEFFEDSWYIYK